MRHDVPLTPLQTAVLAHLMSRAGEVCSRQDLMRDALGYPNAVGSRTIDVHVATLRSKLDGALRIRAVRGVGYALERPAVTERSDDGE
nr:winged helix-turn-helix domain-containing protein [Phytoactinopolyspora alkaliphila]